MNQWRSPTAEKIFAGRALINTRSAGTSNKARTRVTASLLQWADIVLVMEEKHKSRLKAQFPGELKYKDVFVLDIPDNYRFMDEELIQELEAAVNPLIQKEAG